MVRSFSRHKECYSYEKIHETLHPTDFFFLQTPISGPYHFSLLSASPYHFHQTNSCRLRRRITDRKINHMCVHQWITLLLTPASASQLVALIEPSVTNLLYIFTVTGLLGLSLCDELPPNQTHAGGLFLLLLVVDSERKISLSQLDIQTILPCTHWPTCSLFV